MFAYCNNNPVIWIDPTGFAISGNIVNDSGAGGVFDSDSGSVLEGRLGTYAELRKLTKGTGYEVHHLVERRFYAAQGMEKFRNNPDKTPSVVLRKDEHRTYTNMARNAFPYGKTNYAQLNVTQIKTYVMTEYRGRNDWIEYVSIFF